MTRDLVREAAAEFLGTAVLIAFGIGVVAQVVLSGNANGTYLSINLGWGLAVIFGVLVAGGVSGAHLNPAVTIALAVHRGLPWGKVPWYIAAQLAGAFAGAAAVYLTYREAFTAFDGGGAILGATARPGSSPPIRSRSCRWREAWSIRSSVRRCSCSASSRSSTPRPKFPAG